MITKVFTKDKNGKISFTEEELQKLLDEIANKAYEEGKEAGKNQNTNIWPYVWYPNWYNDRISWTSNTNDPIRTTVSGITINSTSNNYTDKPLC